MGDSDRFSPPPANPGISAQTFDQTLNLNQNYIKTPNKNSLNSKAIQTIINPQNKTKSEKLYICSLNVRTLKDDHRLDELLNALDNIKWHILGLAEVRRNSEFLGEYKAGIVLCHSAAKKGCYGTGFILKKQLKKHLKEFIAISTRISAIVLKINTAEILIIQAHAPTSEAKESDKIEFYDTFKATLNTYNKFNRTTILLGNFNGRVGQKLTSDTNSIGNFGSGIRNPNGQKLVDFANSQNLKIINTFYKSKPTRQ